ncbi:hypothetical protein FS749_008621, partial [Ceratobasidium sp. UAMH 11750]
MCPPENNVKLEEAEDTLSPDLFSGINQGAKAKNEVPEAPAHPKVINSGPVRAKVEDDDDVLTSLCALFDEMWSDSESESDDSEPGS